MSAEASDAVTLPRDLGRSDLTCRATAAWADHVSTPVLGVCHEALTRHVAEKARLAEVVEETLGALP